MQGAGGKPHNFMVNRNGPPPSNLNGQVGARQLPKNQLGGVIFGCKHNTMDECLSKQLFGLPSYHFIYVKNIDQGLPLFLFHYTGRKLYGIFEAASSGQLNIDPYGWTAGGSEKTKYPAQVQVRVRQLCQPLAEEHFRPLIADNYYNWNHFWFELDHIQTERLIASLASSPAAPGSIQLPKPKPRIIFKSKRSTSTKEVYVPSGVDLLDISKRKMECISAVPSLNAVKEGEEEFMSSGFGVEHSLNSSRTSETQGFSSFDPPKNDPDMKAVQPDELHPVLKKLEGVALQPVHEGSSGKEVFENPTLMNNIKLGDTDTHGKDRESNNESTCSSSQCQSVISQLIQDIEVLKAFKMEHTLRMASMEQKLVEAEKEIQWFKAHCILPDSMSTQIVEPVGKKLIETLDQPDLDNVDSMTVLETCDQLNLEAVDSVLLVGGYDGQSWLSTLDAYFPSHDTIKPLMPMNSARSHASVAWLAGEIYCFGGATGESDYIYFDTVESYNPSNNQWTVRPSLNKKKGSLDGATIGDKLYAVGGGNGFECFSDVEMLDLDIGRWIPARSMLQKRFSVAAAELNGALYATGGFDGSYLSSAERFDPREHAWTKIASMSTRRGCHSLVLLNEKLYALGGFDGTSMVPTVEIFDPRLGSWLTGEPMNQSRGYAAAATLKDSIYVVGGIRSEEDIVDTVEIFKEGQCWKTSNAAQKRCFLSAITF